MNDINIMNNEAALAILQRANDALKAIGVPCILAPMSLPQGMTISLHAGATAEMCVAANVASSCGGEAAHAQSTHDEFKSKVANALAFDASVGADFVRLTSNPQWKPVGRVPVASGKLLLVDPCYIDRHWQEQQFEDIRRYRNLQTGSVLQYKVDFEHYEALIPAYGKTMNQLAQSGEWVEVPEAVPYGFGYNTVCRATINYAACEVAGRAVAFGTGYGDGHYPVFVRMNAQGRLMQVLIDFTESEDAAIALGMIDSKN